MSSSKKIGIMVCEKTTKICGGCGCFKAFNNKEKAFTIYENDNVELRGFFHCNGCNSTLESDLNEKVSIIKKHGIKTIHMAFCIKVECGRYEEIKSYIRNEGFDIIEGTH